MTVRTFLNETLNPVAWREGVVDALYRAGRHKDASRFKECGVSVKIFCANCGETKKVPYYCMRRYCPQCARRYSNKIQIKLYKRLKGLRAFENSESRYKLRMITLTIRTDGDYAGALCKVGDTLPKLWRNMLARDKFGMKIKKGGDIATGWINSIEFGPKTLNVHVHGVYWGPFIRQHDLSEEWKRLTGSCVVDIRKADNKSLREVVKYASNFSKVSPEGVVIIAEHLEGKRRIRTYGVFRGVESEVVEDLKIITGDTACPKCGCSDWMTERGLSWMGIRAGPAFDFNEVSFKG